VSGVTGSEMIDETRDLWATVFGFVVARRIDS
jgi:hypothetical protein